MSNWSDMSGADRTTVLKALLPIYEVNPWLQAPTNNITHALMLNKNETIVQGGFTINGAASMDQQAAVNECKAKL
jgi:hypothetical protein